MPKYYISESNLAYYLIRNKNVYLQETGEAALMVKLDVNGVRVRVEHDGKVSSLDLPTKSNVLATFRQDKAAGILLTPQSDYRLFIRDLCHHITAFCRSNTLPFVGVIPL